MKISEMLGSSKTEKLLICREVYSQYDKETDKEIKQNLLNIWNELHRQIKETDKIIESLLTLGK